MIVIMLSLLQLTIADYTVIATTNYCWLLLLTIADYCALITVVKRRIWLMLSGAVQRREAHCNLYKQLVEKFDKKLSKHTQQIDAVCIALLIDMCVYFLTCKLCDCPKDMDRTFLEHPFFASTQTQEIVRRILYMYSWYNSKVNMRVIYWLAEQKSEYRFEHRLGTARV